MAAELEDQLRELGPEVPSEAVGLAVLERLRALDPVSYLRFASVYKGFEDVADFEREVVLLQKTTAPKPPPLEAPRGGPLLTFPQVSDDPAPTIDKRGTPVV